MSTPSMPRPPPHSSTAHATPEGVPRDDGEHHQGHGDPLPRPRGPPTSTFPTGMLEHLKETATPIRISYTRIKYFVHTVLILIVAWETLWLLSRVARLRPPIAQSAPPAASTLSAADQAPLAWFQLPATLPWPPVPTSPLSKALPSLNLLTPNLARLLVPTCSLSVLSGALLQHLLTLLFTLTYLTLGLVSTVTYAPLVDKITHVYLVWPFTYLALDSLLATRRTPAYFGIAGPASRAPADDLSCTQLAVPLLVLGVYHLYLRRTLVAVRLWQHSRSFPHRHALAHQHVISLGLVALKCAPGVHPHKHLASQVRQVLYRVYTLFAPYVAQWLVRHAVGGTGGAFPVGWAHVSPVTCVASWVAVKVFVSFHCFQVECLVWSPGGIGKEGVLVWRGERDGWRAGVFE